MHFSVPLQYRTFTFLESSTHARPDRSSAWPDFVRTAAWRRWWRSSLHSGRARRGGCGWRCYRARKLWASYTA